MNLTLEQIKRLVEDKEVQSRVVVKDGEVFILTTDTKSLKEWNEGKEISNPNPQTWNEVRTSNGKVKWQVSKDYTVQLKGKSVWWCPECKVLEHSVRSKPYHCLNTLKPLRFLLTKIEKEKLWDISFTEGKKEGFRTSVDFLRHFYEKNGRVWYRKKFDFEKKWNPKVWVRTMEVKKDG